MSLSMTLGGSMPSTLPSLTVGTLEVTGAATFAATVTATGQFLGGDGSAAAPSYSFTNFATAGMYAFAGGVGLSYGGLRASITALGVVINSGQLLGWAPGGAGSPADAILTRDAADTIAQRNGANAQAFRVYNTYTDGSNYERAGITWSANVCYVGTVEGRAGTGQARTVALYAGDSLYFFTAESHRWSMNASGHFIAVADNTYDIGASGATRPRNVYVGTFISAPTWKLGAAGSVTSQADGVWVCYDNAGTSFGRLCFGGTTSAFPCLRRSGSNLLLQGADAVAYAGLTLDILDAQTSVKVAGTKVLGAQGAAVADATGAGDVVAQLNTLLARLRTHGLIAT